MKARPRTAPADSLRHTMAGWLNLGAGFCFFYILRFEMVVSEKRRVTGSIRPEYPIVENDDRPEIRS